MGTTERKIGSVLSELARDNYRGLVDPHSYRLQRAQLLDQLVDLHGDDDDEEASSTTRPHPPGSDRRAGNPPLSDPANLRRRDVDKVREQVETADVLDLVSASAPQVATAAPAVSLAPDAAVAPAIAEPSPAVPPTPPSTPAPPTPPSTPAPQQSTSRWPLVAGVTAGVLLLAAIGFVMLGGDDGTDSETVADTPQLAGERLLAVFAGRGDWSQNALESLSREWSQLLPSQREETTDTVVFQSFAHDVREQLLENAALRELGGGMSGRDQALIDLAVALKLREPVPVRATSEPPDLELPPPAIQATQPELPAAANQDTQRDRVVAQTPKLQPPPSPSQPADTVTPVDKAARPAVPARQPPPPEPRAPAPEPAPEANSQAAAQQPAAVEPASPTSVVAPTDKGCHPGLLRTRQRTCRDALQTGGEGPRMAIVRAGSFTMGSEWDASEQPAHTVNIREAFGIGTHEITHGEYIAYCKAEAQPCPSSPWGSDDYPVVGVSWQEADAYTKWLTAQSGRRYRLPSESEWEYASRAGTSTRYPFGDELLPVQARYASDRGNDAPWPAAYKDSPRNAFGLYNTIGNVAEWVADAWHDNHSGAPVDGTARGTADGGRRVVRGGSFINDVTGVRPSSRVALSASDKNRHTGFRVVVEF